jgi:hypothetical protein
MKFIAQYNSDIASDGKYDCGIASSHLNLTATLPDARRRASAHAKLDCCVAQIVDKYRGAECY